MKRIITATIALGILIGTRVNNQTPEYVTVNFEDNHYIVEESSPSAEIVPIAHAQEPAETPKEESNPDVEKMLNYIHGAESTYGRNTNPYALHNLCAAKGEWNELGYGGMALKICFKNEEEGMAKVRDWLTRKLEQFNGDEAKTLCHYNLGGEHINCKYYQNYIGGEI